MGQISTSRLNGLPRPLAVFADLTILFTALTWAFAVICHLVGLRGLYSWPYYHHDFGTDFTSFQQRFQFFHSAAFFQFKGPVFLYPAPLAIFYHLLFAVWGDHPQSIRIFIVFTLTGAGVATFLFFKALRHRGMPPITAALFCLISYVCSYPLYFDIQRGNVEVIVWICLMLAFWTFRTQHLTAAAILIGVAIAFKWYPVILLGLFLYPRKYKLIPLALMTAVLISLLSDLWLGPSIKVAFVETLHGTQTFVELYARHYNDLGYDHSFFSMFKFLMIPFDPALTRDLNRYLAIAAVSATVLYFLRIRKLPVINQICILLILSITLPPVSYDYTLLHLYICLAIFSLYLVDSARAGKRVPRAGWTMAWFAFALAPHGYVIFFHERFCAQLRFIGIAALLYIFLKEPFPEPVNSTPDSAPPTFFTSASEGAPA